jgi:hypothetical protein
MLSLRLARLGLVLGLAVCAAEPASALKTLDMKSSRFQAEILKRNLPTKTRPVLTRLSGCTFYEHANAGGQSWRRAATSQFEWGTERFYVAKVNFSARANDSISSVKCDWVPGKRECGGYVFTEPDQSGKRLFVMGSSGVVNFSGEFNDTISSATIVCDPN